LLESDDCALALLCRPLWPDTNQTDRSRLATTATGDSLHEAGADATVHPLRQASKRSPGPLLER
jgi:hypothetical protein